MWALLFYASKMDEKMVGRLASILFQCENKTHKLKFGGWIIIRVTAYAILIHRNKIAVSRPSSKYCSYSKTLSNHFHSKMICYRIDWQRKFASFYVYLWTRMNLQLDSIASCDNIEKVCIDNLLLFSITYVYVCSLWMHQDYDRSP